MANKAHLFPAEPIGSRAPVCADAGYLGGSNALLALRHKIELLETVPMRLTERRETWRQLRELVLSGLWQHWGAKAPDRYRGYVASLTGRVVAQLHHDEIGPPHLRALRRASDLLSQDDSVTQEEYDAYRSEWEHAQVDTLPSLPRYLRAVKQDLGIS